VPALRPQSKSDTPEPPMPSVRPQDRVSPYSFTFADGRQPPTLSPPTSMPPTVAACPPPAPSSVTSSLPARAGSAIKASGPVGGDLLFLRVAPASRRPLCRAAATTSCCQSPSAPLQAPPPRKRSLTSLNATLPHHHASIASKRLTKTLTPSNATLTKNRGGGPQTIVLHGGQHTTR